MIKNNLKTNILFIFSIIFILFIVNNSYAGNRVWKNNPFLTTLPSNGVNNHNGSDADVIEASEEDVNLELQGIWKSGAFFNAMISDTILSYNDKIGEYRVKRISEDKVVLYSNKTGRTIKLELTE